MLGGLGFYLAGGFDVGEQCDVDETDVFLADFECELAQGFDEKQAFHVADGAADFGDEDVRLWIVLGDFVHAGLNFIRHVRDELDGFPQIVATALLFND